MDEEYQQAIESIAHQVRRLQSIYGIDIDTAMKVIKAKVRRFIKTQLEKEGFLPRFPP